MVGNLRGSRAWPADLLRPLADQFDAANAVEAMSFVAERTWSQSKAEI
jgi:hypothetical protein